jgi:F0F1-type ATP synthase alpha subunit
MRATGLEDACMHDVVYIADEIPSLVVALERNDVRLVPLVDASVAPGASVHLRGRPAIHVGPSLLGRVITGPELLLQSREPLADRPLFSVPRPRWGKPRKPGVFTTGLLVHDMKGELRRGAAILFPSARVSRMFALQVGSGILRHQENAGAICVFVRLQSSASSLDARQQLQALTREQESIFGNNTWSKTVFLEPGKHATPAMSWLLCRAAVAVAQAFAERGADVVLMVDGFFNLGGMGVSQLPSFSQFAELGIVTSAADCHETGSLTILITGHGSAGTEHLQFFDVQLELERTLMGSIASRGSVNCRPPIRVEPMAGLSSILSASACADSARGFTADGVEVTRGRRVQEVLRFQIASRLDLLEQLLCVLAVERLDVLDVGDVARFVEEYIQLLRERHTDYLQTLRLSKLVHNDPSEVWITAAIQVATALKSKKSEDFADATVERPVSVRPWWKFW